MIEDLYTSIKTQQYPPPFFSTTLHNKVLQAIQDISSILAVGLVQIWKCKAATINPSKALSKPNPRSSTLRSNSIKPLISTNIITNYFQPTPVFHKPTELHILTTKIPPTSNLNPSSNPNTIIAPSVIQLPLPTLVPPLTDTQLLQIQQTFHPPHDSTIISNNFNIPITKEVIRCLNPHQSPAHQWLNDNVINYYLQMLQEKFQPVSSKLHIFTTFFMEKLSPTKDSTKVSQFKYSEISRWTHNPRRTINLFQKEIVIIPINYHNVHWTVAIIYPSKRTVLYLDSMNNSNRKAHDYLNIIQRYLAKEAIVTNTVLNISTWSFQCPTVPMQSNGHDCGVYLLMFSHLIAHELPIDSITPQDIPILRQSICLAIQTTTVITTRDPTANTIVSSSPPDIITIFKPTAPTRPTSKRKTIYTGSYNEDHMERKQRKIPTEFPCPTDLHFHPTDQFANRRAGIATSRIADGGLGLFVTREHDIGDIIGHFFGGVKLTKENLHLHLPSLYAYFDDHNGIYIDPYDPVTHTISCSAAYANDNIQNPDLNNAEITSYTDGTVTLRAIKKIFQYEEVSTCYGPDQWRTLLYPLSLLLIAQKAYKKENDPEWITLITTKRAMDDIDTSEQAPLNPSPTNPNPNSNPNPNPNPTPNSPNPNPTHPNPTNPNPNHILTSTPPRHYEHVPTPPESLPTQPLQIPTIQSTTNTEHVTVQPTHLDSSEPQLQHHPSPIPVNTNDDNPQQEQIMNLPMEQLELIISFSSHIAAINYLQSQLLHHRHWIQHQLQYLRLLETNQPQLQVFPIILQLELDYYTTVNDDSYNPTFHASDIHQMIYHTPHVGIFTPIEDNHIQLQHLSTHINTNIFPKSTLMSFITNSPIVCLISNSNISIFNIKDSYIQQLVFNSTTQPPSPITKTSKKRKREYKTSETDRITNYKWYHRNKTWLAKKYKSTHSKPGAIQLLNQHPEADIQTLIQTYTPKPPPPISVSTTTKTWNDIFTKPTQHKTSPCPPTETKSDTNKRKHDDTTTTTTTQSITQFITITKQNTQPENSVTTTQPTTEFKTSENRRHSKSIWYHQNKDTVSLQNKEKRAKRKLEELTAPKPPGIQAFFSKKSKPNDDTKPP
jgi:hypothetical protein